MYVAFLKIPPFLNPPGVISLLFRSLAFGMGSMP